MTEYSEEEIMAQEKCVDGGTCKFHGVEMERRKGDRTRVEDLIDDISENKGHVGTLLTFMNRALGFSLLGVIFILGAYTFTYIHTLSSDLRIERNTKDIHAVDLRVTEFRIEQARTQTSLQTVIDSNNTTNNKITHLIDLINEDRRVRNENIINMGDPPVRQGSF